tara:strand:- start:121 stop:333 length:213 start_codon:yes stop_codon:yes gene_type:complete
METNTKDLQVHQFKRELSTPDGHRSSNAFNASGYWKEMSPIAFSSVLYFSLPASNAGFDVTEAALHPYHV